MLIASSILESMNPTGFKTNITPKLGAGIIGPRHHSQSMCTSMEAIQVACMLAMCLLYRIISNNKSNLMSQGTHFAVFKL